MNILFMTLLDFDSISVRNIYTDILRKFHSEGHAIYVVSPTERRKCKGTRYLRPEDSVWILKPRIGNIQKTNTIEKGISTLTLEGKFIAAIRKYFAQIRFDLVIYPTPPITLLKAVAYVKRRDGAATYLMLKDIFPQNAVDMGMLSRSGAKGILYRHFRRKEKKLYEASDFIGCMSKANMRYLQRHNKEIPPSKVEICPNCIEPSKEKSDISPAEKDALRRKYGIPQDAVVFVYGGNLGKPQRVDFIIQCLKASEPIEGIFILIAGAGTEYGKLDAAIRGSHLTKAKLVFPRKNMTPCCTYAMWACCFWTSGSPSPTSPPAYCPTWMPGSPCSPWSMRAPMWGKPCGRADSAGSAKATMHPMWRGCWSASETGGYGNGRTSLSGGALRSRGGLPCDHVTFRSLMGEPEPGSN